MADPGKQDQPKQDVEKVLDEFEAREKTLLGFCSRTRALIEAILQDAGIKYQSVQFRVKSANKLRQKYLDSTKNYTRLDDITDLAGLRVITYYEEDIDRVAKVIQQEFSVDLNNSVDKRNTDPDRFGYTALNYVCKHHEKRAGDVEYKKFAGICCEIQITTILRHAWAEVEHEWYDLKDAYPEKVKRRFYRLAALLELAESEFQDIRKQKSDYEKSVAVRVEAQAPDVPIDVVSVKAFIDQEQTVREMDEILARILQFKLIKDLPEAALEQRTSLIRATGIGNFQQIRDTLAKYKAEIEEFVLACRASIWHPKGSEAFSGLSLYHLGLYLASTRGSGEILQYLEASGVKNITWDVGAAAEIARLIHKKYEEYRR
jgi:putative GTP pyrophosphokinase